MKANAEMSKAVIKGMVSVYRNIGESHSKMTEVGSASVDEFDTNGYAEREFFHSHPRVNAMIHGKYTKPEEEARTAMECGYELQSAGKITDAIDMYILSIQLHPTAEAHTLLGWAFSCLGKFNRAITECSKAIDLDPEFGNAYNDIGVYKMHLGEWNEAETWLERALATRRYNVPHFAHFNLGRLYEHGGQWREALGEYQHALDLDPFYHPAAIAKMLLHARLN